MLKTIIITVMLVTALLGTACGEEMNTNTKLLIIAIEADDADFVRKAFETDAKFTINARDEEQFTLLHYAAFYGRREIAAILIDKGADINAPGLADLTPLHVAAMEGQREVVELLIDRGANVNALASQMGLTPYGAAIVGGKMDIASLLKTHGGH